MEKKNDFEAMKEGWTQVKEQRQRYLEEKELEKERKKLQTDNREHGVRERSVGDDIQRTAEKSQTNSAYMSDERATIIFGKKYVKGDKNSRIRLVLLLLLLAAVVAFFIIIYNLPN